MPKPLPETDLDTFLQLDIRAGTVTRAEPFPEARSPALKLWIDFGPELGQRASSAQLTRRYAVEDLVGSAVLAVVNVPPRRVAGFRSEVLVVGVVDPDDPGDVVLVRPDARAGDVRGWRLA
jgi:tRNA-binding protein